MKKSLLLIAIVAIATLSGCRREDIREFTVEMPSLTEADKSKVVDAFTIRSPGRPPRVYEGIFTDSFKFDFDKNHNFGAAGSSPRSTAPGASLLCANANESFLVGPAFGLR